MFLEIQKNIDSSKNRNHPDNKYKQYQRPNQPIPNPFYSQPKNQPKNFQQPLRQPTISQHAINQHQLRAYTNPRQNQQKPNKQMPKKRNFEQPKKNIRSNSELQKSENLNRENNLGNKRLIKKKREFLQSAIKGQKKQQKAQMDQEKQLKEYRSILEEKKNKLNKKQTITAQNKIKQSIPEKKESYKTHQNFVQYMCSQEEFLLRLQIFERSQERGDDLNQKETSFSIFQLNPKTRKPDPKLAIKKYYRPSPNQQEQQKYSYKRSPQCLHRTIVHLIGNVLDSDNQYSQRGDNQISFQIIHAFMWDRFRAINGDITRLSEQYYSTKQIIEGLQLMIRFLILSINQGRDSLDFDQKLNKQTLVNAMQILQKCYRRVQSQLFPILLANCEQFSKQKTLQQVKLKNIYLSPNVPQFLSYNILLNVNSININRILFHISQISISQLGDFKKILVNYEEVQRTLHFVKAIQNKEYCRYFRLIEDTNTSYLMACCALYHLKDIRLTGLNIILNSYVFDKYSNLLIPLTCLGFKKNMEQFQKFCSQIKIQVIINELQNGNTKVKKNFSNNKLQDYIVGCHNFERNKKSKSMYNGQDRKNYYKNNEVSREFLVRGLFKQDNYYNELIESIGKKIELQNKQILYQKYQKFQIKITKPQTKQTQALQKITYHRNIKKVLFRVFSNCHQRRLKKIKRIQRLCSILKRHQWNLCQKGFQLILKNDQCMILIWQKFRKWRIYCLKQKKKKLLKDAKNIAFINQIDDSFIDYSFYNFKKFAAQNRFFAEGDNIQKIQKSHQNSFSFSYFSNRSVVLKAIQNKQQQLRLNNFWGVLCSSIINYCPLTALKHNSNFYYKIIIFCKLDNSSSINVARCLLQYFCKSKQMLKFQRFVITSHRFLQLKFQIFFESEYEEKKLILLLNVVRVENLHLTKQQQIKMRRVVFGCDICYYLLINQDNSNIQSFLRCYSCCKIPKEYSLMIIKVTDQYRKIDEIEDFVRHKIHPPYLFKQINILPYNTEHMYGKIPTVKKHILSIIVLTTKQKIYLPEISQVQIKYLIAEIKTLLPQLLEFDTRIQDSFLPFYCSEFINMCLQQIIQTDQLIKKHKNRLIDQIPQQNNCRIIKRIKFYGFSQRIKNYNNLVNIILNILMPIFLQQQQDIEQVQKYIEQYVITNTIWNNNWIQFYTCILNILQQRAINLVYLPEEWRFQLDFNELVKRVQKVKEDSRSFKRRREMGKGQLQQINLQSKQYLRKLIKI